jgi:hypothetical protein
MNEEQLALDAEYNRSVETAETFSAEDDHSQWLQKADRAFRDSSDYYETSLNPTWRSNLAHFRSEHAPGSKYHSEVYRHRSKIFRPKPRAAMRTLEATAAAALFTNDDLIAVRGVDPNNPLQAEAAKLHKALLQHRLETTVPWFLTVIGAYQDTNIYGVCISKQKWDYRVKTKVSYEVALDEAGMPMIDEDGMLLGTENKQVEVIADTPDVTLIPPDNFRFDPNADWRDVVKSSPYLIELMPMYAGDVLAMMKQADDKTGQPAWHEYTLGEILAAGSYEGDDGETVRQAREGQGREDPKDIDVEGQFQNVWVHFNIMRDESGEDWAFYTIGTKRLLTDPKPLKEMFPHGRELYRVGYSSIETHRTHPSAVIELTRPLTEMLNDTANQRMDNVKLVLNKRYALRRGANIDLGALMRNVPGGGVLMDNIQEDIRVLETNDVTSSSYMEQDRLSVEADEILGTFSQASVASNRSLNETVGGMNLMASGANQVQELGLRTFIETWVEPVLRTLVKLESMYETDEHIVALAAGQAEIVGMIDDELMQQDLVIHVNVGMGNTNPQQKMMRFLEPLNAAAQFPEFIQRLDFVEIGKEIFSLSGQGDGSRFMLTDEKMAERAEAEGQQQDPRIMIEQMRLEIRQLELEQEGILKQMEIQAKQEVEMAKLAVQERLKMTELYEKLGMTQQEMGLKAQLESARDKTARDIAVLTSKYNHLRMSLKAQNMNMGYDSFG